MNEQQQRALAEGLRALADRTKTASASPSIERAVIAEMVTRRARRRRRHPLRFVGLAAGLLLAVSIAAWSVRSDAPVAVDAQLIAPGGFVELPNVGALARDRERKHRPRLVAPIGTAAYGMSIVAGMTGAAVEAELLVAQDGQPRAIRLVTDSDNQRSRP